MSSAHASAATASLRVSGIGIILFGAARLFYRFTELVVAALFPVFFLAFGPTVACTAAAAFLTQGQPKLGGAGGALREDHLVYGQIARGQPRRRRRAPWSSALASSSNTLARKQSALISSSSSRTPPSKLLH